MSAGGGRRRHARRGALLSPARGDARRRGPRRPRAHPRPRARGHRAARESQREPRGSRAPARTTSRSPSSSARPTRRRWSGSSTPARTSSARSTPTSRSAEREPVTYTWDGAHRRRRPVPPGRYRLLVELPSRTARWSGRGGSRVLDAGAVRSHDRLGARADRDPGRLRRGRRRAGLARSARRACVGDGVGAGRSRRCSSPATSGTSRGSSTSAQPGAGRRSALRRRPPAVARRSRWLFRRHPQRVRRSPPSPCCRCGCRSRSAARRRTCWCRSTW